jgi:hypothetical protein
MAVTPTVPNPVILDNAALSIDGKPLDCLTNHLEISPDTSVTTLDTFCGSRDYPGITKWSLVATLYQSFDPDATEDVLSAAVAGGEPVPFTVLPDRSQPVGPTNPEFSGEVIPQPYAPINGDAGDASTIELEWSMTGPPAKAVAPAGG